MTYEDMVDVLDAIKERLGVPYCYYQFDDPAELVGQNRYIAYFEYEKVRFLADDSVYQYTPRFAVELYTTKKKDFELEGALIELLDEKGAVWSGGGTEYISSEKMYQTVFYC